MDSHYSTNGMGWESGGRSLVSAAEELGGDQWSSQFAQLEPKSGGLHPEDELATVESIAAMALQRIFLMCCGV